MNLVRRIKNLLLWSQIPPREFFNPTSETIEKWQKITEPFVVKGDGRGEYLPMMTEDEMNQHLKENDLGWKKVYDKIRNLGKPPDANT